MGRNRQFLYVTCSLITLASFSSPVLAQAPSNEKLYAMILKLQKNQERLEKQVAAMAQRAEQAEQQLAQISNNASGLSVPAQYGDVEAMASTQAVAATNFRLGIQGGSAHSRGYGFVDGSVATPLGERMGFQADAIGGLTADGGIAGTAAHLFWRDPKKGAIGVYGSFLNGTGTYVDNNNDAYSGYREAKIGAEGQAYFDQFSVEALAGIKWNSFDEKSEFFDDVRLAWYPTDVLKLNIGHRYSGDATGNQLVGGAEYLTSFNTGTAAAVYTDLAVGLDGDNKGDVSVLGGLRFHFGSGNKSLIRRDREDYLPSYIGRDVNDMPRAVNSVLAGQPGAPGTAGTPGADGSAGVPGLTGAPGATGPRGEQGSMGGPGAPGTSGAQGEPGMPGLPGVPGTNGEAGMPGLPGNTGPVGAPGLPGPPGTPGIGPL